jgi:hypothetical protein
MNRDFLKEAIADAKTVKESAIANAKAALEESFTPHFKSMLAAKLQEMEEEEMEEDIDRKAIDKEIGYKEDKESEIPTAKKKSFTAKYGEDEAAVEKEIGYKKDKHFDGKMEEEMDLDELLRELDAEDEGQMYDDEEELEESKEKEEESLDEAKEEMEPEEDETEIDLEDMTDEDLKSFIADVIKDMVEAGELEAGHGSEGEEESEEDETELEEYGDEHPISREDALKSKMKRHHEEEEEEELEEAKHHMMMRRKHVKHEEELDETKKSKKKMEDEAKKMKKELDEAYSAIKTLSSELNEINLLNAKLLYSNKIFKSKSLSESQKIKVLNSFDKATSVKEVKIIFETLSESLKSTKTSTIKENLGLASKQTGAVKTDRKPIVETDLMVQRFQKLAGII